MSKKQSKNEKKMSKDIKDNGTIEQKESELKFSSYNLKKGERNEFILMKEFEEICNLKIGGHYSDKPSKKTYFLNKTESNGLSLSISSWGDWNDELKEYDPSSYENFYLSAKQKELLYEGQICLKKDGTTFEKDYQTFFYFIVKE